MIFTKFDRYFYSPWDFKGSEHVDQFVKKKNTRPTLYFTIN